MGSFHIIDGNPDDFSGLPVGLAVTLEAAKANLWALQVSENANGLSSFIRGFADPIVVLLVIGVITVGKVQPCDIHPVTHQTQNCIFIGHSRAKCAYDLRSSVHVVHLALHSNSDSNPLRRG